MNKAQRNDWVERGYKDPFVAYGEHRSSAAKRGISFGLSFDQWWDLWRDHYHRRGRNVGQMCMCRERDEGGYELGNVRIDTIRSNAAEQGVVRRVARAQAVACKTTDQHRPKPASSVAWMWRGNVFAEYSEEGLDE